MWQEPSPTRSEESGKDERETQSQRWDQVRHRGEEWERPRHYRVVSRRLINGGNGLVTECVVDQLSSRLLANGGVSDGRRGASRR